MPIKKKSHKKACKARIAHQPCYQPEARHAANKKQYKGSELAQCSVLYSTPCVSVMASSASGPTATQQAVGVTFVSQAWVNKHGLDVHDFKVPATYLYDVPGSKKQ